MIVGSVASFSQSFALSSHTANQNLMICILLITFLRYMGLYGSQNGPTWAHMGPWAPSRKPQSQFFDRRLQRNGGVWNLPGGPADPADPAEVVARSAVRSPTSTRARGQDDVSFTNSLK